MHFLYSAKEWMIFFQKRINVVFLIIYSGGEKEVYALVELILGYFREKI